METKQAVRHFKNPILLLVAIILMIMRYTVPAVYAEESSGKIKTLEDFKGKTISILSGTTFDVHLKNNEILKGDVKILYQNSDIDSISSVLSGKSDAFIMDKPIAETIVSEHDEIMIFPEIVQEDQYGFGFRKGSPLVQPFNEAMGRLMSQGLEEELKSKWMGKDESAKKLIPQDWEGKNGTLRYWVNTGTPPMSYLGPEGTPVGYAIDYVLHVAREMDYKVEITECSFGGLIPALQGGKADLAGRSMSITEERLKKIDFSEPFYSGGSVFGVLKENVDETLLPTEETGQDEKNGGEGFLSSVYKSFYRTFIQEDRWRVFLTGLLNTLCITFTSMLFGCMLGFLLYFLCRKTGKKVQRIVEIVTGVITGIPAVVLLMVLFYVIFGKNDISGIIVSIIAFTLTFGTSTYSMLKTGTGAVDLGQTEGSYALGFSDNEAFFLVILPQALIHILPIFKGELVSLLKATAEVNEVIKNLASSGITILIVTHDMAFARDISSRIFYMDEGIIYEEGTPQEIFEEPKKVKTLQFVKKLFVLEEEIRSRDYDFEVLVKKIYEQMIQMKSIGNIWHNSVLLLDELINNVLLSLLEDPLHIHLKIECKKNSIVLNVEYGGTGLDLKSLLAEKAKSPVGMEDQDDWLPVSARIINSYAEDMTFIRQEGELCNCIRIVVSESAKKGRRSFASGQA